MNKANSETSHDGSEGSVTAKKSQINWLAIAAWLVSFVTATLVLLGYGVSLAAESMLGIPHAAVFDSTFELMDLASVAILEILPTLSDALSQWTFYFGLYKEQGVMIGLFAAAWLVVTLIGRVWQPQRAVDLKSVKVSRPEKLYWGRTAKEYWLGNAIIVLALALSPLLAVLFVFAIVAMLVVLAIVPIIGMSAGTAHINKWVIAPEHCIQTVSLENRRQQIGVKRTPGEKTAHAANCVAVKKDRDVIAKGRVVFYTSKAVVLMENNGRAQRVPITDAIVEAVSDISERTTLSKSDKEDAKQKDN